MQARHLVATALLLVAVGPLALAQNEPYRVRDTVSDCLNVRPDHDTETDPIACLPPGTEVTVVGSVPYWREIRFGDDSQAGWAAKRYLEPVTTPEPAPDDGGIPADAFLEVHFVDVGQGDAIWIHTHDDGIDGNGRFEGRNIVIDGGPYSADNSNPLRPYLEERGHHGAIIDALIVTHPHSDHYYGAETIARHFTVRDYYDPGYPSTLSTYTAFLGALRGDGGNPPQAEHLHLGQDNFGTFDWGSEVDMRVLYSWAPDTSGIGSGNTKINNSSMVLRLQYGDHVFLLMGDAEGKDREDDPDEAQYVENILLTTVPAADLRATVLKVGHHGSETSSTEPFIAAVDPDIVVVQSGRKSFHGTFIPDASTLRRYCCHDPNVRIYRTDQGDEVAGLAGIAAADSDHVVIRTNGTGIDVSVFEGGQPFEVASCQPACDG